MQSITMSYDILLTSWAELHGLRAFQRSTESLSGQFYYHNIHLDGLLAACTLALEIPAVA